MPNDTDMVLVYTGDFMVVGQLKSLLEAEGIEAFIQDEIMSTMHPVVGRARLMVARTGSNKHLAKARELVDDFLRERAIEGERVPKTPNVIKGVVQALVAVVAVFLLGYWVTSWPAFQRAGPHAAGDRRDLEEYLGDMMALDDDGKYAEAVSVGEKALHIAEARSPTFDGDREYTLSWLARLQLRQGHNVEAASLFDRLLRLQEKRLGEHNQHLVDTLFGLAHAYVLQGKYEEAEPLYQRIIRIAVTTGGSEHQDVLDARRQLRDLYLEVGDYEQAAQQEREVLSVVSTKFGPDNPRAILAATRLAYTYELMGNYTSAAALYERVVAAREKQFGPDHPAVAAALVDYANMLEKIGETGRTEALKVRARDIRSHRKESLTGSTGSTGKTGSTE